MDGLTPNKSSKIIKIGFLSAFLYCLKLIKVRIEK